MSTLPNTCPRCGEPIGKSGRSGLLICGGCGYIPGVTKLDSASPTETFDFADLGESDVGSAIRLPMQITYRGELENRARGLYQDGVAAAARGAVAQALDHFRDALGIEPEFVDAHMAIARLSTDAAVQREHLGAALAYDPGNGEALRFAEVEARQPSCLIVIHSRAIRRAAFASIGGWYGRSTRL